MNKAKYELKMYPTGNVGEINKVIIETGEIEDTKENRRQLVDKFFRGNKWYYFEERANDFIENNKKVLLMFGKNKEEGIYILSIFPKVENYLNENDGYLYETDFTLSCDVSDRDSANEYLQEDNMLFYFDNKKLKEDIYFIKWELKTLRKGKVFLLAKRKLTESELQEFSEFVRSQNSDGLGEGFGQQYFSLGCFFDWETNLYPFKRI